VEISTHFNSKQQVFLDYVLLNHATMGVDELALDKLTALLRLKYKNSIADAFADLGPPELINAAFNGFQRYLYAQSG
jgi:type I restriction enzyme R subunit